MLVKKLVAAGNSFSKLPSFGSPVVFRLLGSSGSRPGVGLIITPNFAATIASGTPLVFDSPQGP